jgi:hypothetical protein
LAADQMKNTAFYMDVFNLLPILSSTEGNCH